MTNDTSIISQSFSFKIEFANIKSISSSHNLNVKFKLGSEDNEGNEVINTEINKFNKKNDNPKKPEEKKQESVIKEEEKTINKTEKIENLKIIKEKLAVKDIKNNNEELFNNSKDNNALTKNLDNILNIKNSLNKYPPKINHHYDQKFRLENKNTFTHLNESLGIVNNEKTPHIFINHLLLKGVVNKNNTEKYITLSVTQRKKSKNVIINYYSPVLINN